MTSTITLGKMLYKYKIYNSVLVIEPTKI
jgi:hypothetical protein